MWMMTTQMWRIVCYVTVSPTPLVTLLHLMGKRQRTSGVHFEYQGETRTPAAKPVAQKKTAVPRTPARGESRDTPAVQPTPVVPTPSQQVESASLSMSVTNFGQNTMVLTSSDDGTINMGDFMTTIMAQIKSVNKIVSKQEESGTSKKRPLEETEVRTIILLHF